MNQSHSRSLAGAIILQLVPALRNDPAGQAVVDIALTLLQAGARAIVAGDGGPLVGELRAFGGEWLPMINDTLKPLRIRGNAREFAKISTERVDIVHAQSAATHKQPVFLVTSFPDRLPGHSYVGNMLRGSLARGDRVIAPSTYVSRAMIERCKLPADRIAALRRVWAVLPEMRVVLVPGRIAPWNGQMNVIDAARLIAAESSRNVAFVFVGEAMRHPRYARSIRRQARVHGVDTLCRFVGHCPDMPAALAAADVVVVAALEPPLSGRTAAETQAMGRPLVTTTVGGIAGKRARPAAHAR
jgi:glycosyltransferase involved in cell wall biosynthesis